MWHDRRHQPPPGLSVSRKSSAATASPMSPTSFASKVKESPGTALAIQILSHQVSKDSSHSAPRTHDKADIRPLKRPQSKSSQPRFFFPYFLSMRRAAFIAVSKTCFCSGFSGRSPFSAIASVANYCRAHYIHKRASKLSWDISSDELMPASMLWRQQTQTTKFKFSRSPSRVFSILDCRSGNSSVEYARNSLHGVKPIARAFAATAYEDGGSSLI